jgi:hypothetical protein
VSGLTSAHSSSSSTIWCSCVSRWRKSAMRWEAVKASNSPGCWQGTRLHHAATSARLVRSTSSRMVRCFSAPTITRWHRVGLRGPPPSPALPNGAYPPDRWRTCSLDPFVRRRGPPNCARYSEAATFRALPSSGCGLPPSRRPRGRRMSL